MSAKYAAIGWNKYKKQYDKIFGLGIGCIVSSFIGIQLYHDAHITPETLIIRTTALTAIFLLHIILIIGPLCRLDTVYLPLLYNRRHLGVTMFVFAAIHGLVCIIQFHALGDIHPLASIFLSNTKYLTISQFPFQVLGFFALIILFLMAATSHDFWLKNLGPTVWKSLHMLVYLAYGLVVLHVALGILQYEDKPVYWVLLLLSFSTIAGLHLVAGYKENKWLNAENDRLSQDGYYDIGRIEDIPDNGAKAVFVDGQNIAIFKYDGQLSAVNNKCRHQGGPLAEGRVIDGCITCPWHGYQYLPHNGQAPPPFTEKLETYEVKLSGSNIWVHPAPKPPGTFVESVKLTP